MRLLYFTPLLSTVGGQERTLTDKANYLVSQGHEVLFVTYEHEGALAYPLDTRVSHVDIHCHFFSLYRLPFWRRPIELLRLKRNFRNTLGGLLSQYRPDVIVVPIPNTENFLWDVMKVAHHTPVVIESHLAHGKAVIERGLTEKWLYWLESPERALRKARLLITLTQGDATCWRMEGLAAVKIIPNPLTCYPPSLVASPSPARIICVGRLTAQKRFDRMIDAFAIIAHKFPEWHIDIYGEGEEKSALTKQIANRSMTGRIRLMPPTTDIYAEYQRSRFFMLSSDFEGFGLVIIEAMACGLPVVATDCPYGPSEIIEDGTTGLLAKMDTHDLAQKMEWMIAHKEERRQMGMKARQAAARYRKEVVMPMWEQAYLQVASTKTTTSFRATGRPTVGW